MKPELDRAIIKAICFYDLYRSPLTFWEIKKNLYQPPKSFELEELREAVDNLIKNKILEQKEGFYFLRGQVNLVATRKDRYLEAQRKIKAVRRMLNCLSRIPFIKAIFLCNTLAYQNTPADSDIDLFIITKQGRIWSARFWSALLLTVLRQRPTLKSKKDKICLSFFVSEDNLNLESIGYETDVYFDYWIKQLLPIWGEQKLIDKFWQENCWLEKKLPGFFPNKTAAEWQLKTTSTLKRLMEVLLKGRIGYYLELMLKKWQLRIMPEILKKKNKEENSNVLIKDSVLKFHDNDTRVEMDRRWREKVAGIENEFLLKRGPSTMQYNSR